MSRTTTALIVKDVKGPFVAEEIKLNALHDDEALVEIHATGICHTDLSCAAGILPAHFPAVFGHEGLFDTLQRGIDSDNMLTANRRWDRP
jgi:Zn-dependent alcohol dehydrogenase